MQINPQTETDLSAILALKTSFLQSNALPPKSREGDVDAEEEVEHSEKIQYCPDPSWGSKSWLMIQIKPLKMHNDIPYTSIYWQIFAVNVYVCMEDHYM